MGDEYNFDPQAFDDNAQAIFNGTPELNTGLIAGGIVQDNAADLAGGGINYDITQQEASTFWDSMMASLGGEATIMDSLTRFAFGDTPSWTEGTGTPLQKTSLAAEVGQSEAAKAKNGSGEPGLLDRMESIYKGLGEKGQGFMWNFLQGAMTAGAVKRQAKAMQMNAEANMMAAKTRQQELDNKILGQGSAGRAWDKVPQMGVSQFTKQRTPMNFTGLISGGRNGT